MNRPSQLDDLKWFYLNDINQILLRNIDIAQSNFITKQDVYWRAMMIELAINGGELVKFCKKVAMPVIAKHDLTGPGLTNVGDLITTFHNSIAHSSTTNSKNYPGRNFRFAMNVFVGLTPNAIDIEGHTIGGKYADDVAVGFGPYLIYYIRHICYLHNYSAYALSKITEGSKQIRVPAIVHSGLSNLI